MKPAPPVMRALPGSTNGEGYRGRRANVPAKPATGAVRYDGYTFGPEQPITGLRIRCGKEGRRSGVRAIHGTSPAGGRPCAGRSQGAEAQLHRHGAHPARPAARGGRPRRAGAGAARHHRRGGARPGGAHRGPGRRGHDRSDPVHAAREEGARARAARGALARPQLHRHRAHPARARARERGCRRPDPARLRRRRGEDPQRDHPHALRPRPAPAGRRRRASRREGQELEAARPVRAQPDQARHRGQARPGRRPPDGDRARDADPVAAPEEQPGADRRAGRRQDRRRRGPRRAHLDEPGARAAQEPADLHARPRRARGRLEVPGRVRGAPEEGDEGDHPARRHHPVHRRAPQPRRCRRRRGRDRRSLDPEAGARPRRAADDRRDDARRVPQVPGARCSARAALPAGACRGAVDRRDGADPARAARPLRGTPPGEDHGRGAARLRDPRRPLHPGPPPARQGDRPDRRGRIAPSHPHDVRTATVARARGRDRDGARGQGSGDRGAGVREGRRAARQGAQALAEAQGARGIVAQRGRRGAAGGRRRTTSPTSSPCGRGSRSSSSPRRSRRS